MTRKVVVEIELDEEEWVAWRWFKDHHSQTEATSPDFDEWYASPLRMTRRDVLEIIADVFYGGKETVL